jgi:hypothetical protein
MAPRMRNIVGWIVACMAAGPWAPAMAVAAPAPPPEPFMAAAGVSTNRDAVQAAEQATRSMLAKFRDRERRPSAVIFLERSGAVGAHSFAQPARTGNGVAVGDAIRKLAGVSTYGTGGAGGVRGVTWWAKQDFEPTVLVLGLSGADLAVRAYFVPARTPGPRDESAPALAAAPRDEAAARRQGESLGRQVPALGGTGFALLLGGLAAELCTPYAGALREALRADVPLVGALGWPGDYVYVDGRETAPPPAAGDPRGGDAAASTPAAGPGLGPGPRASGPPAGPGPILVVIQGRLDVALAGTCSRNEGDAEAVLAEADDVAQRAARLLGGPKPELVVAFSHTARLRGSALRDPGQELARLRTVLGRDVTFFGGFTPFQAGVDNLGRVSIGPSRLMLLAVAAKAEEKK